MGFPRALLVVAFFISVHLLTGKEANTATTIPESPAVTPVTIGTSDPITAGGLSVRLQCAPEGHFVLLTDNSTIQSRFGQLRLTSFKEGSCNATGDFANVSIEFHANKSRKVTWKMEFNRENLSNEWSYGGGMVVRIGRVLFQAIEMGWSPSSKSSNAADVNITLYRDDESSLYTLMATNLRVAPHVGDLNGMSDGGMWMRRGRWAALKG